MLPMTPLWLGKRMQKRLQTLFGSSRRIALTGIDRPAVDIRFDALTAELRLPTTVSWDTPSFNDAIKLTKPRPEGFLGDIRMVIRYYQGMAFTQTRADCGLTQI